MSSSSTQQCIICQETKPLTCFNKDKGFKSGYRSTCKPCRSQRRAQLATSYAKEHEESSKQEIDVDATKECTQCRKVLPLSAFGYKKHLKSGTNASCKSCATKAQMITDRSKKLLVQRYLQKKSCVDCGCSDWRLLENDHTENNKSHRSSGKSYRTLSKLPTLDKIAKEIKKCEVVCVMCHRKRTHSRFDESNVSDMKQKKLERREFVNKKKLEVGACVECKTIVTIETAFLFDWDHLIEDEKESSISDLCNFLKSYEAIEKELKKCRLLCCKCHRLHTRNVGEWVDVNNASVDELTKIDKVLQENGL
jgi:hypothetical protein